MAKLPTHPLQHACLEGELPGARGTDPKVLLHQPGLFGSQSAVEEVIQPAKRLFTRTAVQLQSPGFDVATPGTGMGLFDQPAKHGVDPAGLGRTIGVHQLLGVAVHLGPALGATQRGSGWCHISSLS